MNVVTRGFRNAFRNTTRTISIVVILGLSIGLSLTMLIAHKAVDQKISSVKSSIGNTISVSPAGLRGLQGGGDPLTADQVASVKNLDHITGIDQSLTDRLTTDNTSLASAVEAGSLGRRFGGESSGTANATGPVFHTMDSSGNETTSFTPPITAIGTTNPTKLDGSSISLTSGSQIDGSADHDTALIGKSLAEKNDLKVGDTFTVYGSTITVAGIFDTGTSFSNNQVIFSLSTLQRLSGQTADITSVTLYVDSISNMDSATSAVKEKLGSAADVTSSKETAEAAVAPLESIKKVSLFSLIGAVIAGGVIILLTMIMIVRERQREIGVLKAIGGSNVRIMGQFVAESITLALLGAVIGLIIGVVGGNPVTKMLVTNGTSDTTTSQQTGGPMLVQGAGPSTNSTTQSGATMRPQGFGGRLRENSAIRGISNINATIGWSIIGYGLAAAVVIALIGSALASTMIARVRPSQVMRTE